MNRQQKIDTILQLIKPNRGCKSIPVRYWLVLGADMRKYIRLTDRGKTAEADKLLTLKQATI